MDVVLSEESSLSEEDDQNNSLQSTSSLGSEDFNVSSQENSIIANVNPEEENNSPQPHLQAPAHAQSQVITSLLEHWKPRNSIPKFGNIVP